MAGGTGNGSNHPGKSPGDEHWDLQYLCSGTAFSVPGCLPGPPAPPPRTYVVSGQGDNSTPVKDAQGLLEVGWLRKTRGAGVPSTEMEDRQEREVSWERAGTPTILPPLPWPTHSDKSGKALDQAARRV